MGFYILMRIGVSLQLRNVPVENETEMFTTLIRYSGIAMGFESIFSFAFAGIYFVVKGNYITEKSWKLGFDGEPKEFKNEKGGLQEKQQGQQTTQKPPSTQKTLREKLEELKEMKEDGLITEEEFERKKRY